MVENIAYNLDTVRRYGHSIANFTEHRKFVLNDLESLQDIAIINSENNVKFKGNTS